MKNVSWFTNLAGKLVGELLIGIARFYQGAISPLLGVHCRYMPSCSEYFIQSVRRRGFVVGTLGRLWRICRCHPLAKGGYDPVLEKGAKAQRKKDY